jgi:hypothetical protein
MTSEDSLRIGQCYFLIAYCDPHFLVPKIRTLIFQGKEETLERGPVWTFATPRSTEIPGRIEIDADDVLNAPTELLSSILDWDGLVRELTENKRAQDRGEIFQGISED